MATEQQQSMTTASEEPRGLDVTEASFDPCGLVVRVSGELDIATTPMLRDDLAAAIDAGKQRLVIDLTAVRFIDSVALATIVHVGQRLAPVGKMALVVDPASYVMLVLESTGLANVLDLGETLADALELVSR